uniref:Uncharacterized protein n=1 Tax=Anguilla anguilla TaxID=7936 RepID=A0A0E9UQN0_ANGAN
MMGVGWLQADWDIMLAPTEHCTVLSHLPWQC